jgi:hypothetical protein
LYGNPRMALDFQLNSPDPASADHDGDVVGV